MSAIEVSRRGCDLATLLVVREPDFLSTFDKPQHDALAVLFLKLRGQQIIAAEVLWGVWLLPLAALVWRSRFLPRFLAVWLVLNGVAYLAVSITGIMWPHYEDKVFTYSQPTMLAEVALMLWLVVKGARPPDSTNRSPA